MAIIRATKPEATYGDFLSHACHQKMQMPYLENSVIGCTRKKRGDQSTRVHITGFAQKLPTVNRWREILHNNQNKTNLIEMFVKYLMTR